jgi:hypothetical protein
VCEAMADVLRGRGCDVSQAGIEFTDSRYLDKFSRFPFRHAIFGILPLLWPQLRRKTGQIRIPDAAREGDYDLVCFGSPTWFFTTNMPLRSYLKSDEARAVLAGKPFAAYVVCRRYWSVNLKEVRKLGTAQKGEYVDGIVSPTRAARFGRCSRCSATSARARCASAPWESRSRRPISSRTSAIRPRRSRTSWRTASGGDSFSRGRFAPPLRGSTLRQHPLKHECGGGGYDQHRDVRAEYPQSATGLAGLSEP